MWTYDQSSGRLTRNGALVSNGYSGKGRGKNNPALEAVVGIGPIPAGKWRMTGIYNSKNVGPYAIVLEPETGTDTKGRSAFRIHGDSIKSPGNASKGCIILPRRIREQMWGSGDKALTVIE